MFNSIGGVCIENILCAKFKASMNALKPPETFTVHLSALVKDYQMPANAQKLADLISAWGRRQIILNKS